jgi:DNA polymerase-3 subunit epsilon
MTTMQVLFLDTETNGLPKNMFAPHTQPNCWPAVLQLSWAIYTVTGSTMKSVTKRDIGLTLDASVPWDTGAAKIHGITEIEARHGVDPAIAFAELEKVLTTVDAIVAHNLAFDKPVIRAAAYAVGNRTVWPTSDVTEICTMRTSRDIVCLPSSPFAKYKHKVPKLNELYAWLYGHSYEMLGASLHSAQADTHCLSQCFLGLLRKGHISFAPTGALVTTGPAVPLLRNTNTALLHSESAH